MISLLGSSGNTMLWLLRDNFSTSTHVLHWFFGSSLLFLTLPLFDCSSQQEATRFDQFNCTIACLALYQYLTAPAALWGILFVIFSYLTQLIVIRSSDFADYDRSDQDNIFAVNSLVIPSILAFVLAIS